jgi:magnesium transporter
MKKHKAKIQNRIFVTDEQQQLKGFVELKEIMFAHPKVALSQLVRRPNITLSVRDRLDAIAADIIKQQTEILPVVDHTNRLMGVITIRELQQAMSGRSGDGMDAGVATNDFLEVLGVIGTACSDLLSYAEPENAGQEVR